MLIACPKCNAMYDVADDLLPESGKKVRCARCGNVWLAKPADRILMPETEDRGWLIEEAVEKIEEIPAELEVLGEEPETAEPLDLEVVVKEPEPVVAPLEENNANDVMAKLADQNETIFRPSTSKPDIEKVSGFGTALGLHKKSNRTLYFVTFCLIVFLSLFYARFEIVRHVPFMGKIYASLGIKATIPGYGLEFQNVTKREFEEDYIHKLEIKGFVANTSTYLVEVPKISIQMLDRETNVLQTSETTVPVPKLAPEGRISFTAVIIKPSTFTAYILLTFTDE